MNNYTTKTYTQNNIDDMLINSIQQPLTLFSILFFSSLILFLLAYWKILAMIHEITKNFKYKNYKLENEIESKIERQQITRKKLENNKELS